jgi:hypothetical protein
VLILLSSISPIAAMPTSSPIGSPPIPQSPDARNLFQLNLRLSGIDINERQSNIFLGDDGQATDSCKTAIVFSLIDGKLFANSTTQSLQFSTDPGVAYANFTPSVSAGAITTRFSINPQNALTWYNDAFYNYNARFCVTTNSDLLVVFADPELAPPNYVFVTLSISRLERCPGAGAGAYVGPAGPTGPQGPQGVGS